LVLALRIVLSTLAMIFRAARSGRDEPPMV
jgi:hypothetical protein